MQTDGQNHALWSEAVLDETLSPPSAGWGSCVLPSFSMPWYPAVRSAIIHLLLSVIIYLFLQLLWGLNERHCEQCLTHSESLLNFTDYDSPPISFLSWEFRGKGVFKGFWWPSHATHTGCHGYGLVQLLFWHLASAVDRRKGKVSPV